MEARWEWLFVSVCEVEHLGCLDDGVLSRLLPWDWRSGRACCHFAGRDVREKVVA